MDISLQGGSGGGGAAWGAITGTLSDQTDLQTALDDKASLTQTNSFGAKNTFATGGVEMLGSLGTGAQSFDRLLTLISTAPSLQLWDNTGTKGGIQLSYKDNNFYLYGLSALNAETYTFMTGSAATGELGLLGALRSGVRVNIDGKGATSSTTAFAVRNSALTELFSIDDSGQVGIGTSGTIFGKLDITSAWGSTLFDVSGANYITAQNGQATYFRNQTTFIATIAEAGVKIGDNIAPSARLHVLGSGSTSATTSLLVQNSSGTDILKTLDDGDVDVLLGTLGTIASTTAKASLNIASGIAPTTPNDGDLWNDGDGIYVSLNSQIKQVELSSHGGLYISSASATTISTINTPVKVAGTTTTNNLILFDDDGATNNRLKYLGKETKVFNVSISCSITAAANNKIYSLYIYKYDDSAASGAIVSSTQIQRKVTTGADVGALSLDSLIDLDENDYIEVWIENNTDTTSPTIEKMIVAIK